MYNTFFSIGLALGPFARAALLGHYPLPAIFLLQAAVLGVMGVPGAFSSGGLGGGRFCAARPTEYRDSSRIVEMMISCR